VFDLVRADARILETFDSRLREEVLDPLPSRCPNWVIEAPMIATRSISYGTRVNDL